MGNDQPVLEIHVYLTSGQSGLFAQSDPEVVQAMMENMLAPQRFFAQPQLMIGDKGSLAVFRTAEITRIDLISDLVPKWPFQFGAVSVREVTELEFTTALSKQHKLADEVGYISLLLTDGQEIHWEVWHPQGMTFGSELPAYIQPAFNTTGLHARRSGLGVMVINPAQIARIDLHPGPSRAPAKVWTASRP